MQTLQLVACLLTFCTFLASGRESVARLDHGVSASSRIDAETWLGQQKHEPSQLHFTQSGTHRAQRKTPSGATSRHNQVRRHVESSEAQVDSTPTGMLAASRLGKSRLPASDIGSPTSPLELELAVSQSSTTSPSSSPATLSSSSVAAVESSSSSSSSPSSSSLPSFPGRQLQVLPIGLGIFGALTTLTLFVSQFPADKEKKK